MKKSRKLSTTKNHTNLKYFFSTFRNSNVTNLTTDVMFSGQRFSILAIFLWSSCIIFFWRRGCVFLYVESLREFEGERLRDFCVFVCGGHVIFCGEVAFFCAQVA